MSQPMMQPYCFWERQRLQCQKSNHFYEKEVGVVHLGKEIDWQARFQKLDDHEAEIESAVCQQLEPLMFEEDKQRKRPDKKFAQIQKHDGFRSPAQDQHILQILERKLAWKMPRAYFKLFAAWKIVHKQLKAEKILGAAEPTDADIVDDVVLADVDQVRSTRLGPPPPP